MPIIDDWVYAWSVEHLLKTGSLQVLDFSSIYAVAQIVWGASFAAVGGFSFGILRLSTVVLSTLGCWAIYLTLVELGTDRIVSLLVTLAVALSPTYFALSFSFMTDVPFVAVSSMSAYFYVSGLVRQRPGRLWLGSLLALLAFLVRPLGAVLPLAAVAGVPLVRLKPDATTVRLKPDTTVLRVLVPVGAGILMMVLAWWALPHLLGRLPVSEHRVESLRYLSMVTAREYANWNINLLFIAAFPMAPAFLMALTTRRRAIAIGLIAIVLIAVLMPTLGAVPTPLPDWQTWSLQDLATRGGLLGGDLQPSAWSIRAMPFVRILGAVVAAAALLGVVATRRQPPAGRVLVMLGVLHVLLINALWFFNDRYYVVFLPALAGCAAALTPRPRRAVWIAVPLLGLWGFISISGTRDMLATNDVVAGLARELEDQGVPPYDIDAGYSLNGWRLYAHPERLPPHADRRYDVPFVTSSTPTRYRIVNVASPGEEVVRTVPLPAAWWQVTDRVFVVRQKER